MKDLNIKRKKHLKLSDKELLRYNRQMILSELGQAGQLKLQQARVLVVGAGGLGCPVLQYLAAAGVGTIGIVDGDLVDVSNLHRQILFTIQDVGRPKAFVAKEKLQALNPHIEIQTYNMRLTEENALEIIKEYDIIADGTDNFPTRYLVNDACVIAGKVNVYASIYRFEGQVSVFNYLQNDGTRGANYRDIYPEPPAAAAVPNCAESGVLGVLAGIMGCMQANEIIKIITGIGEPLVGRLLLFDAKDMRAHLIKIPQKTNISITELIDYDVFCNVPKESPVRSIQVEELQLMKAEESDFQLIDVREPHEHATFNLGGLLIPMQTIDSQLQHIAQNRMVIMYCQSGQRSTQVVRKLQEAGYDNLYNLAGGVAAWQSLQTV